MGSYVVILVFSGENENDAIYQKAHKSGLFYSYKADITAIIMVLW